MASTLNPRQGSCDSLKALSNETGASFWALLVLETERVEDEGCFLPEIAGKIHLL